MGVVEIILNLSEAYEAGLVENKEKWVWAEFHCFEPYWQEFFSLLLITLPQIRYVLKPPENALGWCFLQPLNLHTEFTHRSLLYRCGSRD